MPASSWGPSEREGVLRDPAHAAKINETNTLVSVAYLILVVDDTFGLR